MESHATQLTALTRLCGQHFRPVTFSFGYFSLGGGKGRAKCLCLGTCEGSCINPIWEEGGPRLFSQKKFLKYPDPPPPNKKRTFPKGDLNRVFTSALAKTTGVRYILQGTYTDTTSFPGPFPCQATEKALGKRLCLCMFLESISRTPQTQEGVLRLLRRAPPSTFVIIGTGLWWAGRVGGGIVILDRHNLSIIPPVERNFEHNTLVSWVTLESKIL